MLYLSKFTVEVGYERAFEGQGSFYRPEKKIRPLSGRPGSYLIKAWRKKGARKEGGIVNKRAIKIRLSGRQPANAPLSLSHPLLMPFITCASHS